MDEALARAQELVDEYARDLAAALPEGSEVFDAHVHLGKDIDGFSGSYEDLIAVNDRYGISRCFMFCLDEPDRHPAFRAANDRTLDYAERSGGRLIPFVRLDLSEGPVEEATRCLDLGARGIKLHPRAERFPEAQLIIAHGGIADLAALAERFAGKAGVFFDTSVWSPVDLLDFYHQISPEQVLYASDYPYGQQPSSLLIALRTAKVAGLDEEQLRNMLAGSASRIADGEPPLEPSPPKGRATFEQPMALARVHQYLSMATPLLWTRQPDTVGVVGLALNACDERNGRVAEFEQIKELLTAARDLWRTLPEIEDERDRVATSRATFRLIHLADILAVTSGA